MTQDTISALALRLVSSLKNNDTTLQLWKFVTFSWKFVTFHRSNGGRTRAPEKVVVEVLRGDLPKHPR
jgi:hypothetical protein